MKLNPGCVAHMIDRDALAIEYTRQNAELNGIQGAEIYSSLGFDDVKDNDFDLVISNIPGKAGEPVISSLLQDASFFPKKGGMVAVVVITPLEETVKNLLEGLTNVEILFQKNRSGHVVFFYKFMDRTDEQVQPDTGGYDRGIYRRNNLEVSFIGLSYRIRTAFNLPEEEVPDRRSDG